MKTVNFFFSHLKGQKGGRRWALAFFLGILGAGAMAPVNAVFLLIPSMIGLIWLTYDSSCVRGAFATGWWFGLGHFVTGLYWVANAFFVQPDRFDYLGVKSWVTMTGQAELVDDLFGSPTGYC